MEYFKGEYSSSLNSEDLHNPDLPMTSNKAKGGTLVMWKSDLDPYITVHCTDSSAFLPIVIDSPNVQTSIHVALYLPTSGKEAEYLAELASLRLTLEELSLKYPNPAIFIRGDANSSKTNTNRSILLRNFCHDINLSRVSISHNTYHHFLGNGASDSDLDVLLFSNQNMVHEELLDLLCCQQHPLVDSHHDLVVSAATIPSRPEASTDRSQNIHAPRVQNTRQKIVWSTEGIAEFEKITSNLLPEIRKRWLTSSSKASTSVLIQSTNFLLNHTASITNRAISLSSPINLKSEKTPKNIRKSSNALAKANSLFKHLSNDSTVTQTSILYARERLQDLKRQHRRLIRKSRMHSNISRDTKLNTIMSADPCNLFKAVKRSKNNSAIKIHKLNVGEKLYEGSQVPDGFYDSISSLKKLDHVALSSSASFMSSSEEYKNILKICSKAPKVPLMSEQKAKEILESIRPSVNDFYSITSSHYLYSGKSGLEHFHFLLNSILQDLDNLTAEEMNTVWACILYKGHSKDRSSDRSYRTISTCPLLSKGIDTYISSLYGSKWTEHEAETQFQGKASSHELAALTLTEVIQHSVNTLAQPIFVVFLDAKSAFDLVLKEFLVNNLYDYGINDQGIILINQRLTNRRTVCEWNKVQMGPIMDECGVEQGGVNSSDLYKVYNNEQLELAQDSNLGVPIGPVTISAIGQADDVTIVSNNLDALQGLLDLSMYYCDKYHVSLSTEKTKLQVYSSKTTEMEAFYAKTVSTINIGGQTIDFVNQAEHVGTTRSVEGNLPHLLSRFTAHRKALFSILPVGLARGHRGNPAASLRAHQVYGTPVLLSGITTLVLTNPEVKLLDQYVKKTLQNIQKLMDRTPNCVVAFLGGHLPGSAVLHMRQLSIFGMICRLPGTPLYQIAEYLLITAKSTSSSWFIQIRDLCLKYCLPSPLSLLQCPPTKARYKSLVRSKITNFWEIKLRAEASGMPSSLQYFKPEFMSLQKPHPIWTTCGSNPFEVHKAVTQTRMLSGRYITDKLARHWTENRSGTCQLLTCRSSQVVGSLEHILLFCPALFQVRARMQLQSLKKASANKDIFRVVLKYIINGDTNSKTQFLLDCSALPEVICLGQKLGIQALELLFSISRNWCYSIHRTRMNKLGFYQFR